MSSSELKKVFPIIKNALLNSEYAYTWPANNIIIIQKNGSEAVFLQFYFLRFNSPMIVRYLVISFLAR